MSTGTTFTLYRRFRTKVSDEVVKKLTDHYRNETLNSYSVSDELKKDEESLLKERPRFAPIGVAYDRKNMGDGGYIPMDFMYVDMETHEDVHKLISSDFPSTFSQLRNHWGLNPYKYADGSRLVTKAEAKQIISAIRYLLSGEYSDKVENILDNEYIRILGEEYPKWSNRKDVNSIYIDRNGSGSYTIDLGDRQGNRECDEENEGQEFCMRSLLSILSAFVYEDEYDFYKCELVLEITAW